VFAVFCVGSDSCDKLITHPFMWAHRVFACDLETPTIRTMAPQTKIKKICRSTSAIPDFFGTWWWLIRGNTNPNYELISKGLVIATLSARKYVALFFKDISP